MADESKVVPRFHLGSLTMGEFEQLFIHLSVHGGSSSANCVFLSFVHLFSIGFLTFFLLLGFVVAYISSLFVFVSLFV